MSRIKEEKAYPKQCLARRRNEIQRMKT